MGMTSSSVERNFLVVSFTVTLSISLTHSCKFHQYNSILEGVEEVLRVDASLLWMEKWKVVKEWWGIWGTLFFIRH